MSEDPNFSNDWHKGFQMGLYSGVSREQERALAWLKFQTLQTQYEGLGWIDACLLLQENFETFIKGETK